MTDTLIDFVKTNQTRIDPNTRIRISFGKCPESPQVIDCRRTPEEITQVLQAVFGQTSPSSYSLVEERVYREGLMECTITPKGETIRMTITHDRQRVMEGVHVYLQETKPIDSENFPTQKSYADAFNRTRHILEYGGLLEIHTILEERPNSYIHTLEIHITTQNLYGTPLFEALEKVVHAVVPVLHI